MNRIRSRAVKAAGALAVAGGALVAAAMPAGATPPTRAWGVSASGFIHINPVAEATYFFTPAVSSAFVYPGFVSTGGILDRASGTEAYSNVGSPKVYLFSQVDQLNASNVMSTCRIGFFGTEGGTPPSRPARSCRRASPPSRSSVTRHPTPRSTSRGSRSR